MNGLSKKDAAMAAGCSAKTASQSAAQFENHPNVIAHIGRLKAVESETVPTAGRDAGQPSVTDIDKSFFDDPKELLREVMNDRKLDIKARMQAAIALLPFEHQKMGETGKKENQSAAAQDVVKGKYAPAAPPQLKLIR